MGLKAGDVFPSKYISQADVLECPGQVMRGTITQVYMGPVKNDNGHDENKALMQISCSDKEFILSARINWETLEREYGYDSDEWLGKPVELFVDPNVTFGAKRTGGVRVRVPKAAATAGNDSLMGKAWAAKLTTALENQKLSFVKLRDWLREKYPNAEALIGQEPSQWPKSWGTGIAEWLSNASDDIPF